MKTNLPTQPKNNISPLQVWWINGGFLLILLLIFSTTLQAQTPEWQWMHSIGGIGPGPNSSDQDEISDFRVDKWGNSYMAGTFYNSIDIQNINLQVPALVTNNRDTENGFLAKFDCEGNVEWASRWGSADAGYITSISMYEDNIYAIGRIATNAGYDLSIGDTIVASGSWNNSRNIIAKYNLDGTLESYTTHANSNLFFTNKSCFQIDENGNMYLLGQAYNSSGMGGYYQGNLIENGTFLLKLDSNTNYINHEKIIEHVTGATAFQINFLELDEDDNIYIGGSLDSAMHTFAGVQPDYGQGRSVSFIAKFNGSFSLNWFEQGMNIGNVVGDQSYNIKVDNNFNVYSSFQSRNYRTSSGGVITGTYFQTDTVKNYYNTLSSFVKFIINKYDENGNLIWMKQVNSSYTDQNSKLDLYVSNDTIVTFGYIGYGNFNIDSYSTNIVNASYMLLKLDTNGNMLDIQFFPTVNGYLQTPYGAFLSSSNNFHLVGTHKNYIEFPDSTLYPLKGAGTNQDIFIAKYGTNTCFRCDSVLLAFEVEQNIGYTAQVTANTTQFAESYEWDFGNGQTSTDSFPTMSIVYPDTGIYTVCLTAQNYCDTQTLCQQIHIGCPPPLAQGFTFALGNNSLEIQSMQVQQYDSYTWYFGDGQSSTDSLPNHTYNTSGTYEVCLVAQNTCGIDSFCQTVNITCPNPIILAAELTQDTFYIAANNMNVVNYDSVYWDFGDGQNSTDLFAENNFAQEGIYNVCFSAFNICGDTTYCQELAIIGTGIVNLNNGGSINVYPNPTNGIINISAKEINANYQIEIIDISGKRVLKDKLNSSQKQVNIENLSNGLYYLHLSNKKESYSVGVIKR